MLVTCDYLEIYLRGKFTNDNTEDFTFIKKDLGTKIYQEAYQVQYQGVLFGTLLCKPRVRVIPEDACHFKVENEQLYIFGTNSVLCHFLNETGLRYQSVTRLDVACDFHEFENGYSPRQFVLDYLSGSIERKGKALAQFNPSYQGKQLTGVGFGSRSSNRFGRLYNKSLLLQKENKPYITAWHTKNNLVGRDVWRLEFTIKGREIKNLFRPTAITQEGRANLTMPVKQAISSEQVLLVHEILAGIFATELNSYFCFVRCDSTRRSRGTVVKLLDFEKYKPVPELILRIAVKRTSTSKSERYKRAVKTLISDYYLTKQQHYLEVACMFIQKYNLHQIVAKRFPYWLKEFAPYVDSQYSYVDLQDMLETIGECE